MNKTLLVAGHEFRAATRRRSFFLVAIGLPLVFAAFVLIRNLVAGSGTASPAELGVPETPTVAEGYVDVAGVVSTVPGQLAAIYRPYATEAEARQAAAGGEVQGYFVIPEGFLGDGDLIYYSRDFSPFGAEAKAEGFRYLLTLNLAGDPQLASLIWEPANLSEVALEARDEAASGGAGVTWMPYAVVMVLFISLSMSSGWLLSSVTNEKDTRMMEVMLSSISPLEMLAGKAIGLGAAGLLQLAIWLLAGNLLLGVAGSALSLPAGFSLGTSAIAGGLLFFLLGYALYAALIAGLGALAPSLRDASQATIIVYIPLMVPLWLINSIMMQPNGAVAVALSIIPFTSPVVMAARLVRVSPPLWQVVLAAALLLVTAYGTLRLVARLFRAQTLLSGQPVSIANLRAALRQS